MPTHRERLETKIKTGGNYFAAPATGLEFISSGCKVLDLALSGGWAERRIANIVGDKSSGKTLLSIEAAANFASKYPKGEIMYREAEAAFDENYAAALGMPVNRVDFSVSLLTVDDLFDDLQKVLTRKKKVPVLYIVDSLDALSDREELGRDFDEHSYGTDKARKMSKLFRELTREMAAANMTLLIVSQVRSRIGIGFGRNTTRSGGRALDFYSSQIIYLSHLATITRTIKGLKRATGVKIMAKVDKNKVGLPFREAQFNIKFGFGVDDVMACLSWLKEIGALKALGIGDITTYTEQLEKLPPAEYRKAVEKLHQAVDVRWREIETTLLPVRRKYGTS